MKSLLLQKLKAFLIHLGVSIAIALCALAVVYLLWYPAPLHKAAGVTQLFAIMLAIDATLGPLLTFIVYKKGKKTLKMDLVVIALVQTCALLYGLYSIYSGRPAYVAYNVDRFDLVRANEIDTRAVNEAKEEYQHPSWLDYDWVHAQIPKDNIDKKNELLFDEVQNGIAPSQRPELYQPLETAYSSIVERAQSLSELEKHNPASLVKATLQEYPEADSFVPLKANAVDMTVLINKKAGGKVVAIVDLRPWELD